jgi:hypothetical protein
MYTVESTQNLVKINNNVSTSFLLSIKKDVKNENHNSDEKTQCGAI